MLTKQQQQHFDVFGFVVLRQLFSPDEMAIIIRDFEAAMLEDRDGKLFDGKTRQQVNDWFLSDLVPSYWSRTNVSRDQSNNC